METDNKLCPFCEESNIHEEHGNVACMDCMTSNDKDVWNTRPLEQQLTKENEKLKTEVEILKDKIEDQDEDYQSLNIMFNKFLKGEEKLKEEVESMRNCGNCGNENAIGGCRLHAPVNYTCINSNYKYWQNPSSGKRIEDLSKSELEEIMNSTAELSKKGKESVGHFNNLLKKTNPNKTVDATIKQNPSSGKG